MEKNDMNYGRIVAMPEEGELLDALQLAQLEQSFRDWAAGAKREDVAVSRKRILLVFLLIRYTGAKLHEALALCPSADIDAAAKTIAFGGRSGVGGEARLVQVSEALMEELAPLSYALEDKNSGCLFTVDPAFVRRKFYERAQECGFSQKQGGPEMLRKARALELMRESLPLPAVQRMLGLSTLDLVSSHVTFSEEEMRQVTRWFLEREAGRKTSARNSFLGKITGLLQGGVQTLVSLRTLDTGTLHTIVTNDSVGTLGLNVGRMVTAEIKAPWLILERADRPGNSSADNAREGVIIRVTGDAINTECVVLIKQGLELCAVVSTPSFDALCLRVGDAARVSFSCYSVILHTE